MRPNKKSGVGGRIWFPGIVGASFFASQKSCRQGHNCGTCGDHTGGETEIYIRTILRISTTHSPLAKLAQFHLCCYAGEEKSVAATKTFSAQIFLSLLLVQALGGEIEANDLGKKLASELAEIGRATDGMAEDFIAVQECFVLARSISSAIAFECGLKLQETCYIRARAYHSSDFYHGPMAMVSDGIKVILFASKHSLHREYDGAHRADCRQCAEKMLELGAELYIVTDDAESYKDLPAHFVALPEADNEYLAVFRFALFTQMLACKVSCGKELDPDSPRALKKVTVTK